MAKLQLFYTWLELIYGCKKKMDMDSKPSVHTTMAALRIFLKNNKKFSFQPTIA